MERVFLETLDGGTWAGATGQAGRVRTAGIAERVGSSFARCAGVDREGVDSATPDQWAEAIINEAVSRDPGKAIEATAHDAHVEVAAFSRPGVTGVALAVVLDREAVGSEPGGERALEVGAGNAHFSLAGRDAVPRPAFDESVDSAGDDFRCRLR